MKNVELSVEIVGSVERAMRIADNRQHCSWSVKRIKLTPSVRYLATVGRFYARRGAYGALARTLLLAR